MKFKYLAIFTLLTASIEAKPIQKDVQVDLYNPIFEDGVLSTDQGGVLESSYIRIQAKDISYSKQMVNGKQELSVKASKDLMVVYGSKVFVGNCLEYNFTTRTGVIYNGKTQSGDWYVGGEKIFLKSDGTYRIFNSYMTTCETSEGEWQIRSRKVTVKDDGVVTARNIQVRFFRFPVFWFPKIRMRLGNLHDIPVEYSAKVGGGQGPRFNMRYKLLDYAGWKAFLQLDYWFKHGPGGSFQTDYEASNRATDFKTNSFLAYDYRRKSAYRGLRDRFVGEFDDRYINDHLRFNVQYEVLSDSQVLSTYFNREYFLHTERHTHIQLRMEEPTFIANLITTPRVNAFQSVNQQFPELYWHIHPLSIPHIPLKFTSKFSLGYLSYVYGNDITQNVSNFHSGRLKIVPEFYMPLPFHPITVTPCVSYIGIGYSESLENRAEWQSVVSMGADANLQLTKFLASNIKHLFEPYARYRYYTQPTVPFDDHYIFTINDVYALMNELRFGVRNQFYYKKNEKIYHPIFLDVYSYAFFNNQTIGSTIPKIYANIHCHLPRVYSSIDSAWNVQHGQIDHINVRFDWTLSAFAAFGASYLHRGSFDYRKANHNNFFLDVFRSQEELVDSPLSDKRDTFLTRLYVRFFHDFIFEGWSRTGWDRKSEPYYNEYRLDLTKFLRCNWRIKFSFIHTEQVSTRFAVSLRLGGRPLKEKPSEFIFW